MRRHALSITIFSFLLLSLNSCKEGPTEHMKENLLWPMAVGNRWIGITEYYDVQGNIVETRRDTMTIVKSLDIGGETWYEFNNGALRTNRSDGIWVSFQASTSNEYTSMFAKYPTTVGDTFSTDKLLQTLGNGSPGDTITTWLQTLSVDSAMTVPFGRRSTYLYRTFLQFSSNPQSGQGIDTWAYAPGIGPIMMRGVENPAGSTYHEWKLERVELK